MAIMRIIFFILFKILFVYSGLCSAAVISAKYLPLQSSILAVSKVNSKYFLTGISLRDCVSEFSTELDRGASSMLLSRYFSSFVFIGGGSLFIYDVASGAKVDNISKFTKNIKLISESSDGIYVAASDGYSVELFTFVKDKLKSLFRKEFEGNVTGVYPDGENKKLYVSNVAGVVSVYSFDGRLLTNINAGAPISSLIFDDKFYKIIVQTPKSLLQINPKDGEIRPIMNGKINYVLRNSSSDKLIISSGSEVSIYDFQNMRKLYSVNGSGQAMDSDGANIIIFANQNVLKIFDIKQNAEVANILVSDNGVAFASPFSNDLQSGRKLACNAINAALSGVYLPKSTQLKNKATVADVLQKEIKNIDEVINLKDVKSPQVSAAKTPQVKESELKSANVKNPSVPSVEDKTVSPSNVYEPTAPAVKNPDELQGSQVPAWVANRKKLPQYNVVKNAATIENGFKEAKLQIKNDAVRQILKKLVEHEEVKKIDHINVKKRVLWQAASKAAMRLDGLIVLVDSWQTPAGQFFVLASLGSPQVIESLGESALREELAILKSKDEEEYMGEKPNKIE